MAMVSTFPFLSFPFHLPFTFFFSLSSWCGNPSWKQGTEGKEVLCCRACSVQGIGNEEEGSMVTACWASRKIWGWWGRGCCARKQGAEGKGQGGVGGGRGWSWEINEWIRDWVNILRITKTWFPHCRRKDLQIWKDEKLEGTLRGQEWN